MTEQDQKDLAAWHAAVMSGSVGRAYDRLITLGAGQEPQKILQFFVDSKLAVDFKHLRGLKRMIGNCYNHEGNFRAAVKIVDSGSLLWGQSDVHTVLKHLLVSRLVDSL